jgi:hypothetical protein
MDLGLLDAVYLCMIFSVLQVRLAGPGADHFTAKISLNCRDEANLIYDILQMPIFLWQQFQAAQATMTLPVNVAACGSLIKKERGFTRP